jgi:prepilin peptidase CpaA
MSAAVLTPTTPAAFGRSKMSPAARRKAWVVSVITLPLLAAAGVLAGSGLHTPVFGTAAVGAAAGLLAVSAVTDLWGRKIYNWATYPAFLWAVAANAVLPLVLGADEAARLGFVGLGNSLLGAAVGFGITLVGYHLSGGGAGDVKLAAALGAMFGPAEVFHTLVAGYAVAGVVVAAWMGWTRGPFQLVRLTLRRFGSAVLPGRVSPLPPDVAETFRRGVPMAPFFAAGAALALLYQVIR